MLIDYGHRSFFYSDGRYNTQPSSLIDREIILNQFRLHVDFIMNNSFIRVCCCSLVGASLPIAQGSLHPHKASVH